LSTSEYPFYLLARTCMLIRAITIIYCLSLLQLGTLRFISETVLPYGGEADLRAGRRSPTSRTAGSGRTAAAGAPTSIFASLARVHSRAAWPCALIRPRPTEGATSPSLGCRKLIMQFADGFREGHTSFPRRCATAFVANGMGNSGSGCRRQSWRSKGIPLLRLLSR
jgi:hypothetical protein